MPFPIISPLPACASLLNPTLLTDVQQSRLHAICSLCCWCNHDNLPSDVTIGNHKPPYSTHKIRKKICGLLEPGRWDATKAFDLQMVGLVQNVAWINMPAAVYSSEHILRQLFYVENVWILISGLNSLDRGRFCSDFKSIIFKFIIQNYDLGTHCEIDLVWMPQNLTYGYSTLVQVMAWSRQASSHYLSQYWPRCMSPSTITRPEWVEQLHDLRDIFFPATCDSGGTEPACAASGWRGLRRLVRSHQVKKKWDHHHHHHRHRYNHHHHHYHHHHPMFFRATPLTLGQFYDCPSVSEETLKNMGKLITSVSSRLPYNHNKTKHNKTVCIFHSICCY